MFESVLVTPPSACLLSCSLLNGNILNKQNPVSSYILTASGICNIQGSVVYFDFLEDYRQN